MERLKEYNVEANQLERKKMRLDDVPEQSWQKIEAYELCYQNVPQVENLRTELDLKVLVELFGRSTQKSIEFLSDVIQTLDLISA